MIRLDVMVGIALVLAGLLALVRVMWARRARRPVVHLLMPDGRQEVAYERIAGYVLDDDPDRGVLQVSLQRGYMRRIVKSGQTLREILPQLAVRYGWRRLGSIAAGSCAFGAWASASFSVVNPGKAQRTSTPGSSATAATSYSSPGWRTKRPAAASSRCSTASRSAPRSPSRVAQRRATVSP